MGLEERRRIALIKEQQSPHFKKELWEALGFELPFEIDIQSFPEHPTILDCYDFYHQNYGPGLVVDVFKAIGNDSIGKEAIRAKIKKVVFQNAALSPEQPGDHEVRLQGDTLYIRQSFYGYADRLFSEPELRKVIENLL